MPKTRINDIKIKKVVKYTLVSSCSFCQSNIGDDPYYVELEGQDSLTLCDTCGENFCDIFGLDYEDEG